MAIVNSKTQRLTFPEIIGHALISYGLKDMEFAKSVALILEELKMKGCEGVNIGNTVFISHYTPDRRTAMLKVLNADTHTNLMGNAEMFLKDALANGTDLFLYVHEDKTPVPVFSYLEKNHIATIDTRKNEDGTFATVINLAPGKEEQPAQPAEAVAE